MFSYLTFSCFFFPLLDLIKCLNLVSVLAAEWENCSRNTLKGLNLLESLSFEDLSNAIVEWKKEIKE